MTKVIQRVTVYPSTSFLQCHILPGHGTFYHIKNQHWYITLFKLQALLEFHHFSHKFLLSVSESTPGYRTASSCYVSPTSSGLCEFLSLSSFPCQIWGILARDGIEYPQIWIFSYVFLMVNLGLWVFGKNDTDTKWSHYVISGNAGFCHKITGDVNLHHLVKVIFSGFFTVKLLFFPFSTPFSESMAISISLSLHISASTLSYNFSLYNVFIYQWPLNLKFLYDWTHAYTYICTKTP